MSKKQTKKTTATKKTTSTKNTEPRSKATAARMTAQKQPPAKHGPAPTAAAQASPNHAASGGAEPRKLEPRMPAPGTLIQKRDRHGAVRCECTVEEGGIRYGNSLYRSLSAAAMAAAKDLGLTNKTQNGFTFWGLSKPPSRSSDPLAALDRAWERYHGTVAAVVKDGVTDENKAKVATAIHKHAQVIGGLQEQVA
jgi:hypothetical protein